MVGCELRLEAAIKSDILVREILLSKKSQGILKSDACGNHGQ